MVKRNEFKKRSRYLAMLTALSLAFSNIGSCVNMVYAAEAQAEDAENSEAQSENEGGSEEENSDENSGEGENSGDNSQEGDSEEENDGEENSGEEGENSENGENENGSEEENDADKDNSKNDPEENGSEENKDEKGTENKDGEQSDSEEEKGSEEEKNGAFADGGSGSGSSRGTVKEASGAKKGTYSLTYSVDPDEGAKVEGPSSVAAGKSAVFTVEAQEGYVIKNVSCEGAEISTVEDVDTASASNAQKRNAGKNDGEKFQTYQIENVEADAEIIIEMDNEDLSAYEAEDSTEINGVTVTAKWNTKESGISADAKLHVEEVTDQSKDKVVEDIEAGKVAQLDPGSNQIQDVVVYDITLADADTVYSAWADGTVLVTFTGTEIEEKIAQADKVSVLHVDEAEDKLTQVAAEDVAGETGSEVSFEAEHFSQYAVTFTANVLAASEVVTPTMSQEEIDAAVAKAASEKKVLEVQAGDYSIDGNSHKKIIIKEAGMTVQLQAGDYTRAQIITRENAKVVLEGDVTFEGQAKETNNTAAAVFVEQGKLTLDTARHTMKVFDYTNGLRVGYVNSDSRSTGNAEFYLTGDGTFDIEKSVNTVSGNYASDDGFPGGPDGVNGSGIALMASGKYQRLLNVKDATLISNENANYGIYRHNIDSNVYINKKMQPVVFDGAQVYIEDNASTGYYDEAYCEGGNLLEVLNDSYLSIRYNGYNGYGYGTAGKSAVTEIGRNYLFKGSTVHMDNNYNTNAFFTSRNTVIDGTTFTANNVKDPEDEEHKDWEPSVEATGIYSAGNLQIINGSTVETNGNAYMGIYACYQSKISESKVVADYNGVGGIEKFPTYIHYGAGIYIELGELTVENSIVEAKDDPYAILISGKNPQSNIHYVGNNVVTLQGEYYDTAAVNGPVVNGFSNSAKGTYFGRNYVLSGSVQGDTANMRYGNDEKGMQFTELNPMIGGNDIVGGDYTNNYAAPINTSHTALTRFDLHQSTNKEAASDVNDFVYYDPNTGDKYAYSFRYNTADEDLNGTGGNAYVWAPVSVLHYDATEGKINGFGTAVQGNVALVNTRGDGSAVGNNGDQGETSDRYATDYTIFGNSMNLTEGELPAAARDGYKFAGWYVADNESAARDFARSGNWAELNKLLNTRFTEDSKVSEDITDVSKGQEEKTIYAKWVLPNQYNIVINYIDERTGAHITASYSSDYMEEGSSYDVDALLNKVIDGYTWIRYEGGQPTGSLNGDLVFNVYYNSNTPAPNPTPSRGGGSGGGSSSGGRGSIITSNGGPGVTIQDENVPLAELPEGTLPEEAVSIPEEDVPLAALPKTGQSAGKEIALLVSAMVLGAAGIFRKKTKED